MKKILIFSIAYSPYCGGAELAVEKVTGKITDFQFDLITLRFDTNLPQFEKIGNVNVYRIGFTKNKPVMSDLIRWPLALNKYLFPFIAYFKAFSLHRKNNYNAIWAIMAAYAGFAAMFFKTFHPGISYLLTLQEGDPFEYILKKVKFVRFFFNRIFTKADCVQAISEYLANWARIMGFRGRLKIVPNAVDVEFFSRAIDPRETEALKKRLGKRADDIFLITTSRLVKKNAVDDIIKSLSHLPADIKLLVLGAGPDESMLINLAKENGLESRVKFVGQVEHDDMPKFLKISDIFIRPSLSEGLGSSFLEAMSVGVPVIASEVGGIPEFLFDPGKNPDRAPTGLFCRAREPKTIAACVMRLVDDSSLRERIIAGAKELVSARYNLDNIALDMADIFRKL